MLITVNKTRYEAYQRARTALLAMTKDPNTQPVVLAEQRGLVLELHCELFYGTPPLAGTVGTLETWHPLG